MIYVPQLQYYSTVFLLIFPLAMSYSFMLLSSIFLFQLELPLALLIRQIEHDELPKHLFVWESLYLSFFLKGKKFCQVKYSRLEAFPLEKEYIISLASDLQGFCREIHQ